MAMPVAITVEGANIMTRSFQIIGQGLTRCHPHMLNIIEALQSTDKVNPTPTPHPNPNPSPNPHPNPNPNPIPNPIPNPNPNPDPN